MLATDGVVPTRLGDPRVSCKCDPFLHPITSFGINISLLNTASTGTFALKNANYCGTSSPADHRTEAAEQSEGYETSVPGLFFDLPPTSVDLEIAEIKRDNAKLSVTVQDFAKRLAVLEDVYRDGHLMPNLRSLLVDFCASHLACLVGSRC